MNSDRNPRAEMAILIIPLGEGYHNVKFRMDNPIKKNSPYGQNRR